MTANSDLEKLIESIPKLDKSWEEKAHDYLNSLAMPPGALGQIHDLTKKLCTIQQTLKPDVSKALCVLSVADHGVVAQGVSKYPQITNAIVKTASAGGAAINAFCRQSKSDFKIIDFGLVGDYLSPEPNQHPVINCKVAHGTADMSLGPAMTEEQCLEAILAGAEKGKTWSQDYDVFIPGEMGIGNTTAASAIFAAFSGLSADTVTGPGTGLEGDALEHKKQVIKKALEVNSPRKGDAFDCLMKVGGLEIAGMVGLILGFASQGKTILLDGFITSSAALIATGLCPASQAYMLAGHQSAEPAHAKMLDELNLDAILKLDMRLGEGIGAALALNTLQASCEVMQSMMTLDEALKL